MRKGWKNSFERNGLKGAMTVGRTNYLDSQYSMVGQWAVPVHKFPISHGAYWGTINLHFLGAQPTSQVCCDKDVNYANNNNNLPDCDPTIGWNFPLFSCTMQLTMTHLLESYNVVSFVTLLLFCVWHTIVWMVYVTVWHYQAAHTNHCDLMSALNTYCLLKNILWPISLPNIFKQLQLDQ